MGFAAPAVRRLQALADELAITRKEIALGYARAAYPGAGIIFGAEAVEQIEENVAIWSRTPPADLVKRVRETFSNTETRVLNPAMWD